MKRYIVIGLFTALALCLVAEVALARGAGYGMGGGYGPGYGYAAIPNLTPEQSSTLQALQQAHLKEVAPLQEDLLKKKTELRSVWLSQNPDQAKITALQTEVLALQGKVQEKGTAYRLEARKVLTPEQQAQLTAYGSGSGHGMGKMGGQMGRW